MREATYDEIKWEILALVDVRSEWPPSVEDVEGIVARNFRMGDTISMGPLHETLHVAHSRVNEVLSHLLNGRDPQDIETDEAGVLTFPEDSWTHKWGEADPHYTHYHPPSY